jgi:hypothetical protein
MTRRGDDVDSDELATMWLRQLLPPLPTDQA